MPQWQSNTRPHFLNLPAAASVWDQVLKYLRRGDTYYSDYHSFPFLYCSLQNASLCTLSITISVWMSSVWNGCPSCFLCIRLLYLLFLPEQYSWSTRATLWINVEGFHRPYQQSPAQCGSRSQLLCSWDYRPLNIQRWTGMDLEP